MRFRFLFGGWRHTDILSTEPNSVKQPWTELPRTGRLRHVAKHNRFGWALRANISERVFDADGQLAEAFACRVVNRVGDRGGGAQHDELAHSLDADGVDHRIRLVD